MWDCLYTHILRYLASNPVAVNITNSRRIVFTCISLILVDKMEILVSILCLYRNNAKICGWPGTAHKSLLSIKSRGYFSFTLLCCMHADDSLWDIIYNIQVFMRTWDCQLIVIQCWIIFILYLRLFVLRLYFIYLFACLYISAQFVLIWLKRHLLPSVATAIGKFYCKNVRMLVHRDRHAVRHTHTDTHTHTHTNLV